MIHLPRPFIPNLRQVKARVICLLVVMVAMVSSGCVSPKVDHNVSEGTETAQDEYVLPYPMNEVCEDAHYEPICFGESERDCFYNAAFVSEEAFCEHYAYRCFYDIAAFEEQFSRCDETEFSYSDCAWLRRTGCGLVSYVEPTDESTSFSIYFDADSQLFRGLRVGEDTAFWCDRNSLLVGDFELFETGLLNLCNTIEETFCCRQ